MAKVNLVFIRSLSYTGTTWINLLLGSHPRALTIGPPQRAFELPPEKADEACLIHHGECDLWPRFIREWDRSSSFFLQLAEHTGREYLVFNNAPREMIETQMDHPDISVRMIHVVRDGRANLASMLRHHPDRYTNVYDATLKWLRPATVRLLGQLEGADFLRLRYEDVVTDPTAALVTAGEYLGLEYPENAYRYWEFEQHLVAGNTGSIELLSRLQGGKGFEHRRRDFYDQMYEELTRDAGARVIDESWKDRLGRHDRFAYDYVFGDLHRELGYESDRFTLAEVRDSLSAWELPLDPEALPDSAPRIPESREPYAEPESGGNGSVLSIREGEKPSPPARSPSSRPRPWLSRILGRA